MKTMKFVATIGTVPGYGHNVTGTPDQADLTNIARIWQDEAGDIFDKTGIYISATMTPSIAVYSTEWGCPRGGEPVLTISGSAGFEDSKDIDQWKGLVIELAARLKKRCKQSSIIIEFEEIEFVRLAD